MLIAEEDGMLNIDGSDFPKKGNYSVGVARQHCGILGKRENCKAGVFVGYSSTKGYGLVDRRLYMPEIWFTEAYAQRRQQCAVPTDLGFKIKNQLASDCCKPWRLPGTFRFDGSVEIQPLVVTGPFWNPCRKVVTTLPMYLRMNACFPACPK